MTLPRRLLIANRGEIACRILRTAKRLGIETVAVYSDADAKAQHVHQADYAQRIGAAPARESYLDIEAILSAAAECGADALHPGYGFLSENADFADACAARGIVFVGPPPAAIRAMGSKSAAKLLMEQAGVPVTPGYHGEDQDPQRLLAEAERIGFPVLIKASAGGGGRGMRRVEDAADFFDALASCQRESVASFGDSQVLIERYLEKPRHIEIQIFADSHGRIIHLGERDCSIQRRHQKVIEEAPAPGLSQSMRTAMGEAAVQAARAVGYIGAGTVEFIVSPDGHFHFMEMNTRLQVEHPVTEMITGLDLVEWQLRVAAGEPLPLEQNAVSFTGHAIEVRLYAEDPARDFLPSIGKITEWVMPESSVAVRIDTGFARGDSITPFYDALLAKLIVHATDREQARRSMRAALESLCIIGVQTNSGFLQALLDTPSFIDADLDTHLIEREREAVSIAMASLPADFWAVAAYAWLASETLPDAPVVPPGPAGWHARHSPWRTSDAWRQSGQARRRLVLRCGIHRAELQLGLPLAAPPTQRWHGVRANPDRLDLCYAGRQWRIERELRELASNDGAGRITLLRAPMPGRITAILVSTDHPVKRGTPLLTLEAMKMEHTLVAPADGTVMRFAAEAGSQINEGTVLIEFDQQTRE